MMKLGTQNLTGAYLGERKLKRAYLGSGAVFTQRAPSRLPSGYTEVEYIESSGGAYIDTGQLPPNMLTTMDVEPLEVNPSNAVGDAQYFIWSFGRNLTVTNQYYQYLFQWTGTGWRANTGVSSRSTEVTVLVDSDTTPRRATIKLDFRNKLAYVDDISAATANNSAYSGNGIPAIRLLYKEMRAKLYSCLMENKYNNTTVREFVPCVDPSGVIGLYDLAEGKFYGNANTTGEFTAGPAV